MRIIYEWREITCDGLLVKPKDVGPYYDTRNLNGYAGFFETEGEALDYFENFEDKYRNDYVLVKVFN